VEWAAEGVVVDPMVLQVNTGPDNNTNTSARECQRVVRHTIFPDGHKRSLKLLVSVGNGRYNWLQDEASMTLRAVGHGNRYTERLLARFQRMQQVSECTVAMRTSFSRSRPSFARIEYAPLYTSQEMQTLVGTIFFATESISARVWRLSH
jgi:hypothetical protein